jgi:uncharacterized membrane protein
MRFLLIVTACLATPAYSAGFIEQICLTKLGPSALCSCTQTVADATLSLADQRTAAKMIAQPDLYYDYAESTRRSQKAFIERYDVWGAAVAETCAVQD